MQRFRFVPPYSLYTIGFVPPYSLYTIGFYKFYMRIELFSASLPLLKHSFLFNQILSITTWSNQSKPYRKIFASFLLQINLLYVKILSNICQLLNYWVKLIPNSFWCLVFPFKQFQVNICKGVGGCVF